MNRDRIANAYEKIAEGYAELALAFAEDQPSPSGSAAAAGVSAPSAPVAALQPLPDAAGAVPPAAPARLPARPPQESAFTKCPAHDKPFTEGKFGPYCTSTSEEPDWSNDRGYCRVTPKSAGAWLRQHPRQATA